MKLEYRPAPFPHIKATELVPPDIYKTMKFPDLEPLAMGRIGRDLYRGEPGWSEIVDQPGWNELYRTVSGIDFIRQIMKLFANDIIRYGCRINLNNLALQEYNEPREEVKKPHLNKEIRPGVLFTRFDFQSIDASYKSYAHVDWPRRIVGGVLFMSSAEDEGIEGGEFALFTDSQFKNDRHCHAAVLARKYPVEHNTGYFFLNFNGGFHGPLPMRKCEGLRKWIYYSISSHRDVWFPAHEMV